MCIASNGYLRYIHICCPVDENSANIEFRVPYSQWYLFNAIPDTNYNANPTNPNGNSKGNPNPNPTYLTNPDNPNTGYRCEYGTLNSMFAKKSSA